VIDSPTVFHDALNAVRLVAVTQFRRRNAKARIRGADAYIAAQRERDSPAQAIALDLCNCRLFEAFELAGDASILRSGGLHRGGVGVALVEFRNVGPGAEGLAAGARDDQHTHRAVLRDLIEDPIDTLPHLHRDCVEPCRIIEDEAGDCTLFAQDDLIADHARGTPTS
jgi:hypothetical protein